MRNQNVAAILVSVQVQAVVGAFLALRQTKREWPGEVMTVGSIAQANGWTR